MTTPCPDCGHPTADPSLPLCTECDEHAQLGEYAPCATHDCEPNDAGTACRICGLPAERDDITPAELVALIAATSADPDTAWNGADLVNFSAIRARP